MAGSRAVTEKVQNEPEDPLAPEIEEVLKTMISACAKNRS